MKVECSEVTNSMGDLLDHHTTPICLVSAYSGALLCSASSMTQKQAVASIKASRVIHLSV